MKRIFAISNRVDIPKPGQPTAGGLDEAIAEPPEGYESIRFGWDGGDKNLLPDSTESLAEHVKVTKVGQTTYITFPLRETDYHHYYNLVSNGILWPSSHYREDLTIDGFNHPDAREAIKSYFKVNKEIAALASNYIKPDDTVMVHDYHLIPMGKELAGLNIENPIGFFYHIPMLNADFLANFDRGQQRFFYTLLENLYHYDLVGVQTKRDLISLRSVIGEAAPEKTPEFFETENFSAKTNSKGRLTKFGAFPVAGNAPKYTKLAIQHADDNDVIRYISRHAEGSLDLFSVERRDYSKGIVPKAMAVGNWLHNFGGDGKRIHLVQVAPKGRDKVRAYQDESMKIETAVESVNEIFGKIIHLDPNKMMRGTHLGMARHASAGLVTPMRDGMNLYVSEFAAAQIGRDHPAPVIVSKYAGIASVFGDAAILVDPLRPGDIARGINRAKIMGKDERQALQGRAQKVMEFFTNTRWQSALIEATQSAAAPRLRP